MKKTAIMVSFVALSTVIAGCGASNTGTTNTAGSNQAAGGSTSSGHPLTIALVPKLVGIPYFNASQEGAEKAGKDLGVNVIYTGPTQADSAAQVKVVEDLIAKHVDVIAVAPDDPAAIQPVLQKAKQAGIKVMDWDTPAGDISQISVHQIDDEVYGRHIADLLAEKMGGKGDYAIITGGLSAANLNAWIDAAEKEMKEKYPNMHLVTNPVPSDEKQQVAHQKALDLLKAYPTLKGFMTFSTPAPLGAAQAIEDQHLIGKVFDVGTALPKDSAPFLKDGSLSVATLWDPAKLGYLTVYLAKDLASGKMPTDGEDIPNVGKIQVKPDGKTVIMGPPTDFTKDNVDQFNF
ncbi:MAG: autoinducer 2 ABC transporter substrate-binding protein [Alicyclobacillus sp.]|nr:autoinducer 2 ABC transporter substrate-binding protein [Alicyclobacillus sp.]